MYVLFFTQLRADYTFLWAPLLSSKRNGLGRWQGDRVSLHNKKYVHLCDKPMKQREGNILENTCVRTELGHKGKVAMGTTGLLLVRTLGQP